MSIRNIIEFSFLIEMVNVVRDELISFTPGAYPVSVVCQWLIIKPRHIEAVRSKFIKGKIILSYSRT